MADQGGGGGQKSHIPPPPPHENLLLLLLLCLSAQNDSVPGKKNPGSSHYEPTVFQYQ